MRISDWSSDVCSSDLLAPAHSGEAVVERLEIARDQGKEIAGLWERVFPLGPAVSLRYAIAVRQQHRKARLVGAHSHPVAAQHIGAVREKGDAEKAFGLALGAEQNGRESRREGVGT